MKTLAVIGILGAFGLCACTTRGISVSRDHTAAAPPAESAGITRGHASKYRAPVTIENAQALSTQDFQELQNQFLIPLQQGRWRYAIEGITLDADGNPPGEWTLLIALDNGQRVKVENFGAWDEATRSHFRGGYRQTLKALELARGQDPALDRYVRYWDPKRRASRVSLVANSTADTQ